MKVTDWRIKLRTFLGKLKFKVISTISLSFKCVLKLDREGAFLISVGSEFQYFGAETENDLSYKEVRDLGTINVPSTDDLSVRS